MEETPNKFELFKTELRDLLNKYNATIYCDVDGTNNVNNVKDTMMATIDGIDYKLCEGIEIVKSDIVIKIESED